MKQRSVIVVDDEDDLREVVTMSLEMMAGWDVRACPDGPSALAEASGRAPDVILLDVMMPGMDGPATLEHLRSDPATSQIPVVFLTAKVQKTELIDLHKLGAQGVIAKPFDPMSLPSQVEELLEAAP